MSHHHCRGRQRPRFLMRRASHHQVLLRQLQRWKQSGLCRLYHAVHCQIGREKEIRYPTRGPRHCRTTTPIALSIRDRPRHGMIMISQRLCSCSWSTDHPCQHSVPEPREPRDLPAEPVRRIQRKPTMNRPPSVSSLNGYPRTMSEGVRFFFLFIFCLLILTAAGRAGPLPDDTTCNV
jgi:hypothetical protein